MRVSSTENETPANSVQKIRSILLANRAICLLSVEVGQRDFLALVTGCHRFSTLRFLSAFS